MSLLIVRCPVKPFTGNHSGLPSDSARTLAHAIEESGCAEHFEWCLVDKASSDDDIGANSANTILVDTGVGTTESMPYADEVLVLLPTIDVRLIEAKVPLANAKKLQQILPNLVEEYVLTGAQSLAVQALPPVPGKPAMQRVLALIDRAWLTWITNQLEALISHRVRLIPDCLVLPLRTEDSAVDTVTIAYQRSAANIILTQRTGEQLGIAWVERAPAIGEVLIPQTLQGATVLEMSWDWLASNAQQFLQDNTSSKAANFALNLLPNTFKRQKSKGLTQFSAMLKRNRNDSSSAVDSKTTWTNPALWSQPTQWAKYFLATVVVGYVLHLGWMVLDNWRWGNQMEVLAAQSLTPGSIAKLNQEKVQDKAVDQKANSNSVMDAFIKQVTQDQRRQGLVADADFAPMAAKLQQLKIVFGSEVLQKIDYDGYGIDFEFKPGSLKQTNADVEQRARALGLMVKALGPNRYRLLPYAGVGS